MNAEIATQDFEKVNVVFRMSRAERAKLKSVAVHQGFRSAEEYLYLIVSKELERFRVSVDVVPGR